MLTVSELARRFGLSRSTLLYYDAIGLLRPSARSDANYRLYSQADVERMELIDMYRRAGLPLKDIARSLASDRSTLGALLESRLRVLNGEVHRLRKQQQLIVQLLKSPALRGKTRAMTKDEWVAILRATGLTEADMRRWHVEFERLSPEAHQDFLESLGIPDEEVVAIRHWAQAGIAE